MDPSETTRLTPKAAATRQRILDTALQLFAAKGYEETTMREIASAAGCSLGLAYRYFASKEDLVLELYRWLVLQLDEQVRVLPVGSIAERFYHLLRALFAEMTPHRLTLGALFGAALNPRSRTGLFGAQGAGIRWHARAAYRAVVAGATDAPRPAQLEDLATLLYGVQLALVLFWLQDLSDDSARTNDLLLFVRDQLARVRPLLRLRPIAQTLARLVSIIGPLLGQDKAPAEGV